jgi:hypothetical protein
VRTEALLLAVAAAGLTTTPALAVDGAVHTINPLLVEAAAGGRAEAVLDGPIADGMRRVFASAAPITVRAQRLQSLSQPGCARLQVTLSQDAVTEPQPDGTSTVGARRLVLRANACADGQPPSEGLQIQRLRAPQRSDAAKGAQ